MLAVIIVALWLGGVTMMLRRNANRSEAQQLSEVALRLQPATFYYVIERDGQQIGAASSGLDTTSNTLIGEEYFVGDYPATGSKPVERRAPTGKTAEERRVAGGKPVERTSARWQTRFTRGLHLSDLTIDIARPTRPLSINASAEEDTVLFIAGTKTTGGHPPARYIFTPPLYTPSLASIVFMLGGPHKIGRKQTMSVFDPITRTVIRPELSIRAESLFTVVDSAVVDDSGTWIPAHRDTVRAWRVEGAPHGLTAWVDAEGRIVAAKAGTFSATRTAFELAFKNQQTK